MSLIMAFVTEDFAVMSGDLRRTKVSNEDIFYDDTRKVFQLNERILSGFSGDCDVMEYVKEELASLSDKSTVEAAVRLIRSRMRKVIAKREDAQLTVLLAGIGDTGKMTLMEISHFSGFKPQKIDVQPGEIKWRFSIGNESPEELVKDRFSKLEAVNAESVANMARDINEEISEKDALVSRQCDVLALVK